MAARENDTQTALPTVAGVRSATVGAGIRRSDRDDLVVIELVQGSTCAAVFTQNAFRAAPVLVAQEHLASMPRWLLINSGNANAGTGKRGLEDARQTCRALARLTGGREEQVMPFSTGVIGEYLPVDKIEAALPVAVRGLAASGWDAAARAIMTTDTRPKIAFRRLTLDGHEVTIMGIAKGAGMIRPNMATMLAFIATDAAMGSALLQQCLAEAVDRSFNCITVDGDTSTNDAAVLMATGASGAPEIAKDHPFYPVFSDALTAVCGDLAEAIVRDGEGATKLLRIQVEEAASEDEAGDVAMSIAHSPLVKTAFFASDPNWGRILAAIGRSDCPGLDISRVYIWLGDVLIVERGERAASYTEAAGRAVMARDDITIRVLLKRGSASRRVLTCDLSYDYVKINAEYRT